LPNTCGPSTIRLRERSERLVMNTDAKAPNPATNVKLQQLGRTLVLQLHMVLRTMRIHDPSNNALLIASESLKDTINTLWAALGGAVRLQFVDGIVYLNDQRIRLDAMVSSQVEHLQSEFSQRGLGGLAFARPVDSHALREFLLRFVRPVENEEQLLELRRSLEDLKDLAMELLDPRHLTDGIEEEQALRIDRKTFALQTYAKTIVAVREFVAKVKAGQDPSDNKLNITRIAQDLVDIATERVNFLIRVAAIKNAAGDYNYNHAANTCVLAVVMGRALSVERLALVDLAMAALFADIGFALLPSAMIERDGELSPEERVQVYDAMIRQIRSIIGKGMINESMMRRVIVAYEHHLPYLDPETGQAGRTHLFSRIVAVADAFDALTTRRPWREGYTADEALRILTKEAGTRYDPLVVRTLVNLMGIYPLGSAVRLQSGELAIVYHNSNQPEHFERPFVKIVKTADGQRVKRTMIRNLAEDQGPGGRIVGMAKAAELGDLDPGMAIVL
jgi:HD-GYP domain-containing protein (c-di-GMP phosphodiesterase class II)